MRRAGCKVVVALALHLTHGRLPEGGTRSCGRLRGGGRARWPRGGSRRCSARHGARPDPSSTRSAGSRGGPRRPVEEAGGQTRGRPARARPDRAARRSPSTCRCCRAAPALSGLPHRRAGPRGCSRRRGGHPQAVGCRGARVPEEVPDGASWSRRAGHRRRREEAEPGREQHEGNRRGHRPTRSPSSPSTPLHTALVNYCHSSYNAGAICATHSSGHRGGGPRRGEPSGGSEPNGNQRASVRSAALIVLLAAVAACGSSVDHESHRRGLGQPADEQRWSGRLGGCGPGGVRVERTMSDDAGFDHGGRGREPVAATSAAGGGAAVPAAPVDGAGAGSAAVASGGAPIKIGSVSALSGPAGAAQAPGVDAVKVWVKAVNAAGWRQRSPGPAVRRRRRRRPCSPRGRPPGSRREQGGHRLRRQLRIADERDRPCLPRAEADPRRRWGRHHARVVREPHVLPRGCGHRPARARSAKILTQFTEGRRNGVLHLHGVRRVLQRAGPPR